MAGRGLKPIMIVWSVVFCALPYLIHTFESNKLNGISHIAITTANLAESNTFYVDIMGGQKVDKLSTDGVFGDDLFYSMFQTEVKQAEAAGASLQDYGICDIKDSGNQEVAWDFILFDDFLVQLIQCQQRGTDTPVRFLRPTHRGAAASGIYSHIALWISENADAKQLVADTLAAERNAGILAGMQTAGPPPATEAQRLNLPTEAFLVPLGPGANIAATRDPTGLKVEFSMRDPVATSGELVSWCKQKAVNKEMLSTADKKETSTVSTHKVVGLHHVEYTVRNINIEKTFYTKVLGGILESEGVFPSFLYQVVSQDDEFEAKGMRVPDTDADQAEFGVLKQWNDKSVRANINFYHFQNTQMENYNFEGLDASGTAEVATANNIDEKIMGPGWERSVVTGFWLKEDENFDAYSADMEQKAADNGLPSLSMNRADGGSGSPNSRAMWQGDLSGFNFVYFKGPSGQTQALVQFRGAAREALKEAMISYGSVSTAFDEINPFKTQSSFAYCCNIKVNVSDDGSINYCNPASGADAVNVNFMSVMMMALSVLLCQKLVRC